MFDHHFLGGLAHDQIALLFMAAAAKAPRRSAVRMSTRVAGISAAILAIATIVMACYIAHMELTGLRATGQVIAIRVDAAGPDREPTYYPVIEFAAASGALLRFEDFGGGSPRYRVGDPVPVLYRGDEASLFAIVDRDRSSNLLLPLLPLCGALWFGWPFVRRIRLRLPAMASGGTASLAVPSAMRSRRRMMNV
ncbi:conserved protein of unknown function [Bradyrhizobium sp. ORS 285]|uniref:DUF3592 domain-containing protein n=1 Tax=Bradyrhizobium sp. ORS 285 TaxID=115808 RepID=UPI0002406817|nr:DUF3592 domain-containing protein [Bradyrhizobium sp. ORS 285]CCD88418.1 conserved hypothetical protein [Bradyrhizobium sp. ORS 285]SMX56831.1 conserved protein of unknown function [Bradyrhizobium sp. ORS 285]